MRGHHTKARLQERRPTGRERNRINAEREKGAEKKEERSKRSKERSRVVGRPTEGERKVEVEVEARWR